MWRFYANGTLAEVNCKQRFPYICFVPAHACGKDNLGSDRDGFPGYVFYPEHNGWLKLHPEPADWQEARINCNLEEALFAANWNAEIRETINKMQTTADQSSDVLYAGAEVTLTLTDDGKYIYSAGEPILSASDFKRQCDVFYANGTMGEVNCKQRFPYICFAPAHACGKDNLGYEFDKRTEHCYYFHKEGANRTVAYNTCGKEGGYLAVINSDAEAELLKQLFAKYPASQLSNYDIPDLAAVGFYYWKLSSSWWTIHGQTIEQAGYDKWRVGEPTLKAFPTARGGFLHRDGTLFSHYLDRKAPFICEKNPTNYSTGSINTQYY